MTMTATAKSAFRPARRLSAALALAAGLAPWIFQVPALADHVPAHETASISAGGRLYDNWIRELAKRAPKQAHPLYPKEGRFNADPATTWRCVTCHGWDYRGAEGVFGKGPDFTGIKGIAAKAGRPVEGIIALLSGDGHGYAEYLDKESMHDLAMFVSQGQINSADAIDPDSRRARGKAGSSGIYFVTVCSGCHGVDGTQMQTIPPIGEVTRNDPWLALHKMFNGHPGDEMPALRVFGQDTVVNMLAYMQGLPGNNVLLSVQRGGKLYDDWAREVNKDVPKTPHPAYPKDKEVPAGSNSWRCVECHGWDYKGAAGLRGIRRMAGAHPAAVVDVLTDKTHAMHRFLKFRDLWDLGSFVAHGQLEMNEFIAPRTKEARGSADEDLAFFYALCATCHGDEGTEIRTMPAMGRVATENPWKALHKIMHGHPGEFMPAWQAALTRQQIKNILATLQTLPKRKR
jgi:mono/diheme cytochrome c family protein